MKNFLNREVIISLFIGIMVSVLFIYLTPVKNLNLIEPKVHNVEPKIAYEEMLKNKDKYMFIDVRSESEYNTMHAEGSINIPLHMMFDAKYTLPKHDKEIVLICAKGRASGVAYGYLEHHGFLNLQRIEGGVSHWEEEGLPVVRK